MGRVVGACVFTACVLLLAQSESQPVPAAKSPEPPVEFICPMDKDMRAKGPGKCSRCGMKLIANLPEHQDYDLRVSSNPRIIRAERPLSLRFDVRHPRTGRPVKEFEVVHEKLFHLFLIGHDLSFFAHEHPEPLAGGSFRISTTLPQPGVYRLLADFYPSGGTPQFLTKTLVTRGAPAEAFAARVALAPDRSPKSGANLRVELVTEPPEPLAGQETLVFFKLNTAEGFEQLLGAWGHLLAASDDLVDLIHDHPLYADGGPTVQFNVIFPREAIYRVWVQFQRKGVVNTVAFNVPVKALR